ncbi:type I-B CRISPR-associated endonuclease Cas1b [Clostridium sp. DL1XJH146]
MKKDIYIFNDGELKRKDNTIYFIGGGRKKYLPVEEINNIWVYGEVDVNKKFLDFIAQKNTCIHFFNYYGYYSGTFYPREHLNSGEVILKQAQFYVDYDRRLELAKLIITTAIKNIIVILKYYNNRGAELIVEIDDVERKLNSMNRAETIDELMAYEGNIREKYYKCFNKIINNEDFAFTTRSRRPPRDKINALISFGNSMMYTSVLSEIYQTHLDPRIGYLHSTNTRKFSLNLDVAEIFKPIIVDRVIFSLLNKRIITAEDFDDKMNGIILNENGKKKFVKEYNDKLTATIKHRKLNTYVTYKRLIRLELYKIQKHIVEDDQYEGFVAKW